VVAHPGSPGVIKDDDATMGAVDKGELVGDDDDGNYDPDAEYPIVWGPFRIKRDAHLANAKHDPIEFPSDDSN
jgi:hypothetical protein